MEMRPKPALINIHGLRFGSGIIEWYWRCTSAGDLKIARKSKTISEDMKFVSAVALFGMKLRKSKYYNNAKFTDVIALAEEGKKDDKNGYKAEFIRLVKSL